MRKTPESNHNNPEKNEPTELESKLATMSEIVDHLRYTFEDFRGRSNFKDEEIDRDSISLAEKEANQTGEADDFAKALEGIIIQLGNNSELFHTPAYAEPGHAFDDSFHGVDAIIGFPKEPGEKYDTVITLDACSAVSVDSVQKKFNRSEESNLKRPDIPYTTMISYFAHGKRRTRIPGAPHYIIGVRAATVAQSILKYEFTDDGEIKHEPDPDLQEKLLIELLFQSGTGYYACKNVPASQRSEKTESALKAHEKVNHACGETLCHLWGIEDGDAASFQKALMDACQKHKEDDTFYSIVKIASQKQADQRKIHKNKQNSSSTNH